MTALSIEDAGNSLNKLIAEVSESHRPIRIGSGAASAVLVSEGDWRALQETVYLLSIPGMRESIREGMDTPADDCADSPGW